MPKLLTPARLTALTGVLTGLAGVAASLTGVIDVHSAVGQGLVALGGYLTTGISVAKFLEGQAGWEQQQSAQVHTASLVALDALRTAEPASLAPTPAPWAEDDPTLNTIPEVADEPEPSRLVEVQP